MVVPLSYFRSKTSQRLREAGRMEAHADVRALTILRILDRKAILNLPAHERIVSCHDRDILDKWLDRAITATSLDDLFHDTES
ncbi:hypothetical protein [Streptomyces luteolus]|uniref:Uncharacterized protein n=1 Tax=Streptomyces luteolus TaxID=3043615 RepID=A0ABT6T8M6_9ACTN|nr:hypothetical protein [Streptomyces sp. B-S-A12]MDI3424230.1 hypothetical protein [Streptomyces sp. B-S-A12]